MLPYNNLEPGKGGFFKCGAYRDRNIEYSSERAF